MVVDQRGIGEYYAGYRDRLNSQTRADLARFAKTYIAGKPMVIGMLASPRVAGYVAEWLRSSGMNPNAAASR